MNFILLLFISLTLSQSYIEVCEPFPIHHNLYNCGETLIITRRVIGTAVCPNQGTWDCSNILCFRDSEVDMDGYCLYGYIDQSNCCTFRNIHYVDIWIAPNNATIPLRRDAEAIKNGPSPDWEIEIYDIDIMGVGPDIWINGTHFPDAYTNGTDLLFISVILRYNGSCHAWVELYIDAVLIANVSTTLISWSYTHILRMIDIPSWGANEQMYFVSAHEIIPTLAQIEYLYNLGPNRTVDTEICYDTEYVIGSSSGLVSDTYFTLTIVFGVIFGIQFCLLLGIVLWWFIRKKTNKEEEEGFFELTSF